MSTKQRPFFASHSDTSTINIKHMVTDLFSQMREPSPGANSPKGSVSSLSNGAVTKNIGFQQHNAELPWASPAISLPGNCNSNLTSETQSSLQRTTSNASALTSLSADLSPSDSHFFEVLYIGKVRISQRKVPESLIDDALNKFTQHEIEKAKNMRRHSLLSSAGTSLYSSDSVENLKTTKSDNSADSLTSKQNLVASTTPLVPIKTTSWKSVEDINKKEPENKDLDQEFDLLCKERVEKNGILKKPTQVPLEPSILVLNVPNNNGNKVNLGTLDEDEEKNDDVQSIISETASSITQFCQNTLRDPEIPIKSITNNRIITQSLVDNSSIVKNPFLENIKSTKETIVTFNETVEIKPNYDMQQHLEEKLEKKTLREDSPAPPLNFDEISRKPKTLLRSKTGLDGVENRRNASMPENKPFLRDRSASIGTLNLKTPISHLIGEQNRTMLFQVARSELRLISPDRKQILLHRAFKDVASCVLGRSNNDHFGFVCRETNDSYACYVFKCESDSVATEVVNAIKQAFIAHAEILKKSREKSPNMTCEHCPMLWYHRLCHDIDGMNEKKTHAFILRRIEQLPEEEQDLIITKYQGGTNHMYEVNEHNSFLMMLLRAHCEAKQQRHVHDTAENRSEFLNQYLGGSTIFMKAKRSLSSGFDHLLKRRASKDDGLQNLHIKKEASPSLLVPPPSPESLSIRSGSEQKSTSPLRTGPNDGPPPSPKDKVSRSDQSEEDSTEEVKEEAETPTKAPMMDIFLKVSDSRSSVSAEGTSESARNWRNAIYNKVVQPADDVEGELTPKTLLGIPTPPKGKRTKEELRELWKMAIEQTLLLVRMEKENAKLKESEESSAVRRIKLEYTELGTNDAGVTLLWDSLLNKDPSRHTARLDRHMLTQAVYQGIPRMLRGGVWYFLAEQACLRGAPPDVKRFPHYNAPYRTLLASLTKHQHAILIDLGRTFPQHSYFASALGPGQLALYNILKAYSLLDPDVGYCQGLSFVAGILLLHMEEADAFILLRHLMFRRGLRKQYLPDMSALQVQLYQVSRLLRDHEPELHAQLERLDISPALYAAPWMLTLFTSQFPLGFVARVFDLIFLDSFEAIFSISLALLSVHKDGLMMCESCEEAAEYLKHKLPDIDNAIYSKIFKKVHGLDISRQLADYAVEYGVLREQAPTVCSLTEENAKLKEDNSRMGQELDSAMDAITNYQNTQSRLETHNKIMEQQLNLLCRYITAHQRQDTPNDIKKIIQTYSKKTSFSHKISSSFSSKFSSNEDDENDPRRSFKTGMSTPNLFSKVSKDDVMNATNREKNKTSPENDRRHFMMKKSQSVHSGLIANNLKQYSLNVLDEKAENEDTKAVIKTDVISESLKELGKRNKGFFSKTHEQILQERMFEKQLKHDFDENLRKLDEKLSPSSYIDDVSLFQGRKSMSLNLKPKTLEIKTSDSGFVTPMSPIDKKDTTDNSSIISHPLSDIDIDIKFESTQLKQIRPLRSNLDSKRL